MSYSHFLLILLTFLTLGALAADRAPTPASPAVFNRVLFSEGTKSWTLRDLSLYQKLIKAISGKDHLIAYSENSVDDFLLSRILHREALLFEIDPLKTDFSVQRFEFADFSKNEIAAETGMILYALALLEFKKNQVTQKERFVAWMDVLKKKYAVKMKNHGQ